MPEDPQVAGVEVFAIFGSLGRLQNHRHIPETWIIDQESKRFQSHAAGPDPRMAIHAAAAVATAIVQVPYAQAIQSD